MEQILDQAIEYKKTYQEYKAELDAELAKTAEGFIRIGYLLKVARDTTVLMESGYKSVTEFAKAEYNIEKSQVSRFIRINDKFSKEGYADSLKDNYKGFGYAKLALMLQLPDEINEEITPDFSKSEIQAIKDEVDAERKITDIDVMLEGEANTTFEMSDDLGKTIMQIGEDDPQLFADIWTGIRKPDWSIEKLQILLSPAGQKIYSARIKGIGRKQLMAKDVDNGNEIVLIDLRTNNKQRYTWEQAERICKEIAAEETETGFKGAWESNYSLEWPIKEKIAPVQQKQVPEEKKPEQKKESKVQKAPVEQTKKEPEAAPILNQMDEMPGQTDIEDFIQGCENEIIIDDEEVIEYDSETMENKTEVIEIDAKSIECETLEDKAWKQRKKQYMEEAKVITENILRYMQEKKYEEAKTQATELTRIIDILDIKEYLNDEEENE